MSMVDNPSKEKRSRVMASIRAKNTKPEIKVRKLLWAKGIRYRIHNRSVFGTPDISIKKRNLAVFIDGCFWHGCKRCYKEPKTNTEFWRNKIANNKNRRRKVKLHLKRADWKILEFWEHEINENPQDLVSSIISLSKE